MKKIAIIPARGGSKRIPRKNIKSFLGKPIIAYSIDRSIGGPDASFSMNEEEFTKMVEGIRQAESAIGKIDYNLTERQNKGRDFSRSLYVVENIKKGELITENNVRSIRPGFGMHPKYYNQIIGKKVRFDIERGTALNSNQIEL